MKRPELTATRLRELLDYDPLSGLFTWKVTPARSVKAGTVAGSLAARGYVNIKVDGKNYKAHRLAFLYMEGEFPLVEVDHINGVPSDNRWSNLRHAERWENQGNVPARSDSKSGVRGVYWVKSKGKWVAQIKSAGRNYHLGYFSTVEEANACYLGAAQLVFGHFAHHLSKEAQ